MIVYDSHKWFTFWSIRGSIFPKAVVYALPSAISAFVLKYFDVLGGKDLLTTGNGTIYSGFTFVLGFILVFRTSQSYNRYWLAATAVHTMRAEWFDACGSLIAFVQITKKGQEHIKEFTHTMIRLFGLMHAMALEEIASMENENFPLLDIAGLRKKDLRVLTHEAAQGRKVEIVAQWIKTSIVNAHENGVLPIPAPILTRVFQELGTGLVHYHEALQVVIWPFPFPYAQMSAVLITVYMVVTPLVICLWTTQAWYTCLATLVSVVCMKGIDVIAIELENPFGDDANDLPTFQMHHAMNRDLVLLANPYTWTVPKLEPHAVTDYKALVQANKDNQLSLQQYQERQEEQRKGLKSMRTAFLTDSRSPKTKVKLNAQNEFQAQDYHGRMSRTGHILGIPRASQFSESTDSTPDGQELEMLQRRTERRHTEPVMDNTSAALLDSWSPSAYARRSQTFGEVPGALPGFVDSSAPVSPHGSTPTCPYPPDGIPVSPPCENVLVHPIGKSYVHRSLTVATDLSSGSHSGHACSRAFSSCAGGQSSC